MAARPLRPEGQDRGEGDDGGVAKALFPDRADVSDQEVRVSDEDVRRRYYQINRNTQHAAGTAARRLDARECEAAHEHRRPKKFKNILKTLKNILF